MADSKFGSIRWSELLGADCLDVKRMSDAILERERKEREARTRLERSLVRPDVREYPDRRAERRVEPRPRLTL